MNNKNNNFIDTCQLFGNYNGENIYYIHVLNMIDQEFSNPHLSTCLGSMAAAQAVMIISYILLYSAAAFRIRTRMNLHRTGGQP